jgi:hypothetical protein
MKTYTFHVSLPDAGDVWRKLELSGEQTLEELHLAIQDAFEWEDDHLYSFFMSGKAWDPASEYTLPEGALYEGLDEAFDAEDDDDEGDEDDEGPGTFSLEDWRNMSEKDRQALMSEFSKETGLPASFFQDMINELEQMEKNPDLFDDEEDIRDVRETKLDSLELKTAQEFMYLFDYGDEHKFKVRVETINTAAAPGGEYPRLLDAGGDAPSQYAAWDDDEWDEDEE